MQECKHQASKRSVTYCPTGDIGEVGEAKKGEGDSMMFSRRKFFELIAGVVAAVKAGPLMAVAPEVAVPETVGLQMKPRQYLMSEVVPYKPGNRYMYVKMESLALSPVLAGSIVAWRCMGVVTPMVLSFQKVAGITVHAMGDKDYGWIYIHDSRKIIL